MKKSLIIFICIFSMISMKKDNYHRDKSGKLYTYNIEYENIPEKISQFYPREMNIIVSEDYIISNIRDRMGLIDIKVIQNIKKSENWMLIDCFNRKYYTYQENENPVLFYYMPKRLSFKNSVKINSLYLTETLGEKIYFEPLPENENPNINTPYADLSGLMYNFFVLFPKFKIDLELKNNDTTSYTMSKIDEYQQISNAQMILILNKILNV